MTHSGLFIFYLLACSAPAFFSGTPAWDDGLNLPPAGPAETLAFRQFQLDCPENTLELIPDGDFGVGSADEPNATEDPELSPNLTFFASPQLVPGSYAIVSNTSGWGTQTDNWITTGDSSADEFGYMMIISASSNESDVIWEQSFGLCEGSEFEFSFDAINLTNTQTQVPEPSLELFLNDESLIDFGDIPQDASWATYTHTFQVPAGEGSATLRLVNNQLGSPGNDLGLDNLTLTTCTPTLDASLNNAAVCPGEPVSLLAEIGSGFTDPVYQWQVSIQGSPFENVGSPTADNFLQIDAVPAAAQYRVLAAPTEASLNPDGCAAISDPVTVQYLSSDECAAFVPITNISDQLCDGILGANLVEGGDFGSGQDTLGPALEPGITTLSHNPVDSFPQQEGQYVIASILDADPCEGQYPEPCWFPLERDTTDSTGYRMIIDASQQPDIFFQAEVTELCENTTYQFSVEVTNLAAPFFAPNDPDFDTEVALPNIDLIVAPTGTPTSVLQTLPATYNSGGIPNDTSMTTVGFTFEMSPGETDIMIAVRNAGPGGFGNDLAIDNVRVSVCGPPSRATYEMTCPDPPPPLTLTAEINGDQMGDNPAIQWVKYDNQSGNFEELDGETGETLDLVVYPPGEVYAFYVAYGPDEIQNPNCRVQSDPAIIDFLPIAVDTMQRAICLNETITINDETYTETGVYTQTFEGAAINGCDSVLVIDLQVADPIRTGFSASICPGESFDFDGQTLTEPGTYENTYTAQGGCDSIVTLELFFNDGLLDISEETICEGDSVLFNGNYYSQTGVYRDTLPAVSGCDTIMELDLTVLETPRREETVELCPGDTFMGIVYFADTTLVDTIPAPSGCDSIITINLDLGPLSGFAIGGSTILCSDSDIILDAGSGGTSYQWSTGETTQTISVGDPGSYFVEVTDGTCTVRDTVEVTEGDMEISVDALAPLCPDDNNGSIAVVNINGGSAPYTYSLNGTAQNDPLWTGLSPGDYEITVESADGCVATESVNLPEPPSFDILVRGEETISPGDSIQLVPTVFNPITGGSWSPATGLSCTNCLNPVASPEVTTTYTVTLFDDRGCMATAQITVNVNDNLPFYAPNAFSPNGDGVNEFFTIYANSAVQQIEQLVIFDRWGAKVFERSPLPPNDETQGWDGTVNGRESPVGVYVFFAEVLLSDNTRQTLKGDITLLR